MALNSSEFRTLTLSSIKSYNHDSSIFSFALPSKDDVSGMTVASCVVTKAAEGAECKDKDGKDVMRPYTPISRPDQKGSIDFLVKNYPDGNMSKHFHELKEGDKLAIKGPLPKFPYKANEFESVTMIAGGSGITPMWQIMQQIKDDKDDKTKVTLIYTNKEEKDILMKEEFDSLSSDPRFKIVYGLDKAPSNFSGFEGYFTKGVAEKNLPSSDEGEKVKIFVCGPPPMYKAICGSKGDGGSQGEIDGILKDLGFKIEQIYKF